jgi:hypothetical protein
VREMNVRNVNVARQLEKLDLVFPAPGKPGG